MELPPQIGADVHRIEFGALTRKARRIFFDSIHSWWFRVELFFLSLFLRTKSCLLSVEGKIGNGYRIIVFRVGLKATELQIGGSRVRRSLLIQRCDEWMVERCRRFVFVTIVHSRGLKCPFVSLVQCSTCTCERSRKWIRILAARFYEYVAHRIVSFRRFISIGESRSSWLMFVTFETNLRKLRELFIANMCFVKH